MSTRHPFVLLLGLLVFLGGRLVGHAEENLTDEKKEHILKAYHALLAAELTSKKVVALPAGRQFVKIDASDRIRSASFGHTTTVLVPTGLPGKHEDPNHATEFYVEHGRSTNAPASTYGPFKLNPPAATP
jgi:hypothetical protein